MNKNKFYNYFDELPLLTDLYQLTMGYGYWKNGIAENDVVFNLYFRQNPFNGGYTVAAGLEYVIKFLKNYHFNENALDYLSTLKNSDGTKIFEIEFLDYLKNIKLELDIDAIEEGKLVFPLEPLIRVRGPIIQAQLIETTLLNIVNFQTLIATKACRIVLAAEGRPIAEFGLRRAQGFDGGISATRAAYIGGCSGTSNVLAAKIFNIPPIGTHSHSWVMFFNNEKEAFDAYIHALPSNCTLLVDTYNTINGVKNAIEAVKNKKNVILKGIRLDSGDLAYLSQKTRELLDEAGLKDTKIIASNDLDEYIIESLIDQKANIDIFGVGTNLVTAKDQPALGGIYKLTAIKNNNRWVPKIKISEQPIKINIPGIQKVKRFYDKDGLMSIDLIYDVTENIEDIEYAIDPFFEYRRKKITDFEESEDLLIPIFKKGELVYNLPTISDIREKLQKDLRRLHYSHKRLKNPHIYPVGISHYLFNLKKRLIMEAKGYE